MQVRFDGFLLDTDKHELWKGDARISVEPQVFALIVHLVTERHRVVSKDELIEVVWEGRFISDSAVSSRIKSARKALGDDGRTQHYIKTLHGTGFRFVADIEAETQTEAASVHPATASEASGAARSISGGHALNAGMWLKPVWLGLLVSVFLVAGLMVWNATLRPRDEGARPSTHEVIGPPSIAVLPFDDFSQAGDQGYFADGIAEEILNVLAQVDGLHVTSRTSAFAFKGKGASIVEIANALGVNHVLEGSVRKSGSILRITAQLIDARSDRHVWSHAYERAYSAENIFAVQEDISRAIALELLGRIDSSIADDALQTASTEAYDAYLRGRSRIKVRTARSIMDGIADLNRAVTLDPGFASAHAALVEAFVLAANYAGLSAEDAGAFAAPHTDRALSLAPDAPEILAMKGRALTFFDGRYNEAIGYFQRAIAANPNFASAYRFLGLAQSNLLHIDAAKTSFETARRLDPLSPVILANLFRTYWDKDDLAAMLAVGEESLRHNADNVFSRRIMGDGLRESGNYAAAHRLFKDNEALFGASRNQLALLYHQIGRDDLAAPYAGGYLKAVAALLKGEQARAAEMARGGSGIYDVAVLRWAGETDAAYRMAKADIANRNLLSPEAQIAARDQTYDIYYADLLSQKGDAAAHNIRTKIGARFADKQPKDFVLRDSLYAGALWNMLNNDGAAALAWLDALIDAGHVWPEIAIEPLFRPIRGTDNFQTRVKLLKANAARFRAAIDVQLADPDDAWILQ